MSRETAEARFAAREAARLWGDHKRHCPVCSAAADARQFDKTCPAGTEIRQQHRDADAELKRNRELDKLPSPDQEAMF